MYKREKVTNILVNSKVTSFLFFRTLGLVTSETSYTVPVPTWFVLVSRYSLEKKKKTKKNQNSKKTTKKSSY